MNKISQLLFVIMLSNNIISCKDNSSERIIKKRTSYQTTLKDSEKSLENEIIFVQGTLDEALNKAKKEGKYLFVVTSLKGCDVCDLYLDNFERDIALKKEIISNYLVYRCNILDSSNRYLGWVLGSIGSPVSVIFSQESEIIKIIEGYKPSSNILSEIKGTVKEKVPQESFSFRKRWSTTEKSNIFLKGYNLLRNDKLESLRNTFDILEEISSKSPSFFCYYLLTMSADKLNKKDKVKAYAKRALLYQDYYSKKLYDDLYSEVKILNSY